MRDLEGKLALVTGGAKNVGKVIARGLSERGADVIINYFHSHEAAKQTKSELEATGSRVEVVRASVAQKHQVDQMFDEIERKYGYLDILVNNAASGAFVPSSEVAEEHFARAIDTNLKGSFWCARHAARLMAKRGGGTIVNVSSVGAGLVPANYVVVGTSKAAVEALTRYLAVEYAPLNIRVNTASASMIEGEVARLFPQYQEMRQSSVEHTPLGRLATAEDLAGVVMFLTSDDSRWVTGQAILADGGLSLSSVALSPARSGNQTLTTETAGPENRVVLSSPPEEAGTTEASLDRTEIEDTEDIAVVGMGLAVPGANSPGEFWRVLMEGPDLFRNVPPDRWDYSSFYSTDATAGDKSYQSRSVFIDSFQPAEELRQDPAWAAKTCEFTTLWLRHSLLQALREVKRKPDDRFSFVVGYTADGSQHLEEAAVLSGALYRWRQVLANISAEESAKEELLGRIESILKERYWRGASDASRYLPHKVGRNAMTGVLPDHTNLMMVDTACSSSLYAVDIAVKGLLTGEHDVAVCGGAFALAPRGSVLFAKLHGLSESGEVRPLDRKCDGVLFADGAGVVVLKRLKRALADGDRILAVIKAFGASSDGKGKAIYAPSSAGQEIAIERALAHPSVSLEHIDWVVAHATGTPAGDMAEFTTLREKMASDHTIYVTSNKSLIGHTGWSAGVASLIEVILGLEKQVIPPQHRFEQPPTEFGIESTNLKIPTAPVPWPRKPGVPRAASISGFGFGGTNAHLVVQDYAPGASSPGPKRSYAERLVIVGWSAHLPGIAEDAEISAWIKGAGSAPALSFGDSYPMPSFEHVRMPPGTVRSIDRCQLMILECARKLKTQLKTFWEIHAERIGVLMGHMGPTRNATLYASRCYMDDMRGAFAANPALNQAPLFEKAFSAFSKEIERLIPQSNENSFPGMMPNVIPARVANYFDLKGLNMTVDTGFSSALTAIETAGRYLRSGELEMALVGAINGNTTPEMAHLVGKPGVALAEGAFLFALTLESVAREAGLTILAHVDPTGEPSSSGCQAVIECGAAGMQGRNYLGAEGALAILKSLHSDSCQADVVCRTDDGSHNSRLRIRPALAPRDERQAPATAVPAQFQEPGHCAPGQPLEVRRHVAVLESKALERIRAGIEFFAPGMLVVTNTPELVERATNLKDVFILSTEPFASSRPNRFHVPEITEEAVSQVLRALPLQLRHLRLVTDLCASSPAGACLEVEPKALVDLHDLTFLALKYGFDSLSGANTSFISLFLDATPHGSLHPFAGFFGGMIKSSALELPSCLVVGVCTSSTDLAEGVRQAEAETTAKQFLPIVVYVDGIRKTFFLDADTGELPQDGEARLSRDSVVVATAGARGITAELLKAVARHFQPRLYLIGSNRLDQYPQGIFEATDEQFAGTRPVYLRQQKAANPSKPVGAINKEFERMAEARVARRNIAEMEKHCGAGRVRYIACDVLDRDAVVQTIGQILQTEERIDLLINAAGLNRSASIPAKSLKDFRTVRDIKLRGYQNLKYALRDSPPKMWCNFGSFIGFTGQLGEADYASANDLLATAAAYAREVLKQDEFTVGWTLWRSVGLGANPVTQAFLEKSGLFTSMSTAEGIHHFIREINLARHDASIIHLGAPEKKAIRDYIPHFFSARAAKSRFGDSRETGRFYLGKTISSIQDEAVFERVFDLERDGYLQHHVVNGYATLPGTFVPEVAAEAALQLVPGTKVIALEDAKFSHFLRVYDKSRLSPKKISARVVERIGEYSVVQVRILTDIAAPNGKLLAKDKLHFEIKVVLGHDYPSAPYWERWGGTGEVSVPDPYHFAAAPVLLTGPFVSTRDTRQHPFGKRATYDLKVDRDDPVFSSFLLPSIMLDGLARIAVLNYVEDDYIPLAAPASIRRIDIYEAGNDCELAERYEQIEFYATPREFALEGENGGNRFVAVRPDGHMIMQMKDVTGVIVGYVHRTTGDFMSAEHMKERQAGAMIAGASRG